MPVRKLVLLTKSLFLLSSLLSCLPGIVGLHLLQPLFVVFLCKSHVPQKLGINPFERFVSMGFGLLDAISVPLTGYVENKTII